MYKEFPSHPTVLRAGAVGVHFWKLGFTCMESYSRRARVEFAPPA
jgi:hypothetical protein